MSNTNCANAFSAQAPDSTSNIQPAIKPRAPITARELDILVWLARGKSGAEVASILGLSVCTVRAHVRNIIRKLNASNIPHAVARAFQIEVLGSHMLF